MNYVFITDLHLKLSSNVRDNLLEDLSNKLQWVVDFANDHDAVILIGGDVFDKPSVPDIVKNTICPILKQAYYTPISINGNHDRLYDNDEYNIKTSYQNLIATEVLKSVDDEVMCINGVAISNKIPVIQRDVPQIVLFHGFLNQEDGRNTFHYQDIAPDLTDETLILLGHDHCEFETMDYLHNVKIIRPGSFNRQTRDEESNRIPKVTLIELKDGKFDISYHEITVARPYEEVFKTKLSTVTKAQQRTTYEDIISQIRDANVGELTLNEALEQVATSDVCNYASKLLQEYRLAKQHEKGNL